MKPLVQDKCKPRFVCFIHLSEYLTSNFNFSFHLATRSGRRERARAGSPAVCQLIVCSENWSYAKVLRYRCETEKGGGGGGVACSSKNRKLMCGARWGYWSRPAQINTCTGNADTVSDDWQEWAISPHQQSIKLWTNRTGWWEWKDLIISTNLLCWVTNADLSVSKQEQSRAIPLWRLELNN